MDALVERRFGRFVIQPERRQLLIDGQPAKIGARAFDILMALVERRHRVATKDELIDLVLQYHNVNAASAAFRYSLRF